MIKINVYGIRGFPFVQGGVEKHSEELYPRLASKDVQIKVFRKKPYVTENGKKEYKNITFVDVWTLKNKYLETILHSFFCAFKTIKDQPDVVHIHNMGPAITLPLLKLFKIKSVVTLHSVNYNHSKWNWFAKFWLRLSEKIVFKYADRIIFVSDAFMNYSLTNSKLKKEKAKKINNGLTNFKNLKPTITLSKYKLKRNEYILFVGRLVPEKRIQDLILAYSKIKTAKKLVIVGGYDNSSKYFDELNKYAPFLKNKLVFTDYLESKDVKLLYENAYLFVLPSENEGMPLVLLEAMSFGVCPLVSDIEENLAVIKTNGFSFKMGDVDDLKKKLEYLLSHKSIALKKGKICKAVVKLDYDWDIVAEKTLDVYRSVLKNG